MEVSIKYPAHIAIVNTLKETVLTLCRMKLKCIGTWNITLSCICILHICNRKVCLCLGHLWDWILCLVSYSVIMYYSLQLLSTTSGKIQPEFGHRRHPRGLQENWISSHMWEIFFFFSFFLWKMRNNYQLSAIEWPTHCHRSKWVMVKLSHLQCHNTFALPCHNISRIIFCHCICKLLWN